MCANLASRQGSGSVGSPGEGDDVPAVEEVESADRVGVGPHSEEARLTKRELLPEVQLWLVQAILSVLVDASEDCEFATFAVPDDERLVPATRAAVRERER